MVGSETSPVGDGSTNPGNNREQLIQDIGNLFEGGASDSGTEGRPRTGQRSSAQEVTDMFTQEFPDDSSTGGPGTQSEAGRTGSQELLDILNEQNPSGAGPTADDRANAATEAAEALASQPAGRGRRSGFLRRGLDKAGGAMGKAGEVAGAIKHGVGDGLGRVGEAGDRMRHMSREEISQVAIIAARHWLQNLSLKNFREKDWYWRGGFAFGAAESLAFTAFAPIPGAKGLIKAGLNLAITQGTHIALNLPQARELARVRREYSGYQVTIDEESTRIKEKYAKAHQRIKDFALGMSAGAMYLSLGSLVSEVGKEALGWDMDKMFQERFRPGEGAPATGGAAPAETPIGTPAPKTAGLAGGEAPKMPAATVAPGPGGLPGGVETPHPPTAPPAPTAVAGAETVSTAAAKPPVVSLVQPAAPAPPLTEAVSAPVSGPGGFTPGVDVGELTPGLSAKPELDSLQGAPAAGLAPGLDIGQPPNTPAKLDFDGLPDAQETGKVPSGGLTQVPAPQPDEIAPVAVPSLPETLTLPKGSNPWSMTKDYLEGKLERPLNQSEISGLTKLAKQVAAENGFSDSTKIPAGKSLNIHAVNEYLGQIREGQSAPSVPVTVDNIRAAEVGKVLSSVQDEAVKKALEQSDQTLAEVDQAAIDKAHQTVQNALEIQANEVYDAAGSNAEAGQKAFESWLATDAAHSQLAEIAKDAVTEQAQAEKLLTNNVFAALEAVPNSFYPDQLITHGTNVGQLLHNVGYQVTWTGADAEMWGAHIAVNHDKLTDWWHQMADKHNIPENPFPVSMTEINDLVTKAKTDKNAFMRLLEALRYIPEGQKLRILNKAGIDIALAALRK